MNPIWSDYLYEHNDLFEKHSVVNLFRKATEYYPDKIAVYSEDEQITYRQLEKWSNQIAHGISQMNTNNHEKIIAISSGRNVYTIAAILGIWKTGVAYAFFDSDSPKEYNDYIHKLCGSKISLSLDIIKTFIKEQPDTFFEEVGEPDRLAVVIFTSGSTGFPKGVMLSHRALTASASNMNILGLDSNTHFGFFASFMFIASVNDLCATLIYGATAYLIPRLIRKDISQLAQYYIDHKITFTYLPPHMAMKYMKMEQSPYLVTLIVGSEPTRNLKKQNYNIVNVYASSEGSSIIAHYSVKDNRVEYPIGKVMPTFHYYICDENLNQVKYGQKGELCISGPQLFSGYLKLEELTNKKRFPNPFDTDPGFEYLFKTGDIVSAGPEGLIFHGRVDHMVKVRGFRIELTGVEKKMLSYPGIKEACCTVFKDNGGTNILFGYYISDNKIDHEKYREYLAAQMPYYMIPSCLIAMDEFPHTPSGKVSRKHFTAPEELNDRSTLLKKYR